MSERSTIALSKKGLLCGQNINKMEFYEDCVFDK
jgi:hypothetical protein